MLFLIILLAYCEPTFLTLSVPVGWLPVNGKFFSTEKDFKLLMIRRQATMKRCVTFTNNGKCKKYCQNVYAFSLLVMPDSLSFFVFIIPPPFFLLLFPPLK